MSKCKFILYFGSHNLGEDTKEMLQSRIATFSRHQRKAKWETNKDKNKH